MEPRKHLSSSHCLRGSFKIRHTARGGKRPGAGRARTPKTRYCKSDNLLLELFGKSAQALTGPDGGPPYKSKAPKSPRASSVCEGYPYRKGCPIVDEKAATPNSASTNGALTRSDGAVAVRLEPAQRSQSSSRNIRLPTTSALTFGQRRPPERTRNSILKEKPTQRTPTR